MKYVVFFFMCVLGLQKVYTQIPSSYVFLGSYNKDTGTEGVYLYNLDTLTGRLTFVSADSTRVNPSYLTLSPDGKFLYACTESLTPGAGSVSSYAFHAENGTLEFLNSKESMGENPVFVAVNKSGKWLVNANYTEGSISVYPVLENGSIGDPVQVFGFTEGSVVPKRQDRSHIHAVVFSPDEQYVFFPDLGADMVRIFEFDSTRSLPLKEINSVGTIPGSGPRHLVFHPNGKFAYCIEELAGAVTVYAYTPGKLDSIQHVITHPQGYKGLVQSSDIRVSPDGKFLYASNRGDQNNIALFSILENGTLKLIGYQPTLGEHPRIFTMDASGKFLITTNLVSGNVVVFRRNAKTGKLKKVHNQVNIKKVSFVLVRSYSNTILK